MRILTTSLLLLTACKGSATPTPPPDCTSGFADRDGDGFGNPDLRTSDCVEPVVSNGEDCNDGDFSARPDADEECDGVDNDCDGLVDVADDSLDLDLQYPDGDGDGFGTGNGVRACETLSGHADQGGDCDDGDIDVNPDALEVCDSIDNDCDDLFDDDDPGLDSIDVYYVDNDLDGYGGTTPVPACEQPAGTAPTNDDCDDGDPDTYPGAVEICDNLDQDCDGDPDAPQFSVDPCDALEAPYVGLYEVTLDDGATLVTCTGTSDFTLDRALSPPLQGTVSCTVDNPQGSWATEQSGSITGLFRADGTIEGTIEAFEGDSYDWSGSIVPESQLTGSGSGLFLGPGTWDLELDLVADWVDVPP